MDEAIPTSPETPGDAVPVAGERAKEVTPAVPSGAAADTDGDFRLAAPAVAPAGNVQEATEGGGDFQPKPPTGEAETLPDPAEAPDVIVESAAATGRASAAEDTAVVDSRPATEDTPAVDSRPVAERAAAVDSAPAAEGVAAAGSVPAADRPQQPRQAPDPYGTPPYGRPGPWAPAPPVQHPATLPAGQAPPAGGTWAAQTDLRQTGAGGPAAGRRRARSRRTFAAGALLLAVVSGVGGGLIGAYLERTGGLEAVQLPQPGPPPPGRPPGSIAGIAARALPSVVTLHVTGTDEQATGTGFVLDGQGHILTNNHVVAPAVSGGGRITVTFSSGAAATATVVGRDSGYDLAVVQVHGVRGLTPLPLGDSDDVRVGDPVVAIGAPFDLPNTVTAGIISAKERPITAGGENSDGSDVSYVDALQTDAPINPGNSGGPLLDSRARAVGVNSAIRSADSADGLGDGQSGSIGLGFAIPINQAKRVAEELIGTGRATHPVIGITLDMNYTGDGARIDDKAADGPGARAGLRAGDVITGLDGQPVHSGEELIVRTRAHRPGDRLSLTVERAGAQIRLALVLGSSDRN
ncbi:trypsin-like peptidase domain-containing protein [Streptomyces sasae]|uniref:trypsin-like peptidase domain-containing protein n=1 Tax=Streptomyces sasae TaxID=1266772 RepID=UPI002931F024|nr:trypsin-like peptidase domain-containing protein [Streptomyces sasae]